MKAKKLFKALTSIDVVVFLIFGIGLLALCMDRFVGSFASPVSFDALLEDTDPEKGMRIEGNVPFSMDCFASEETWTENKDGSRTPARTSHYYYAIPTANGYVALEVGSDRHSSMEDLVEETYNYLMDETAPEPSTVVEISGLVKKIKEDDLDRFFVEYLEEMGYTSSEIAAMGELFVIEEANFGFAKGQGFVGIVLILLGVVFWIIRYKQALKKEAEEEAARAAIQAARDAQSDYPDVK